MPPFVSIRDAEKNLSALIRSLKPGEVVVLTEDERPVAQLSPVTLPRRLATPGRCEGMLTIVAEDDEHLQDFKDYMS